VPAEALKLKLMGYSDAVIHTMLASRRASSNYQYKGYLQRWEAYCKTGQCDSIITDTQTVLAFLQTLVQQGLSYSSINLAKSAVSTVVILPGGIQLGTVPEVKTFLRGVYNIRPPTPRHAVIWDPERVLMYFKTKGAPNVLTTEFLVRKLAMLILLSSGQRPQILVALATDTLVLDDMNATFIIKNNQLKQGRLGYTPPNVHLKAYPADESLCVLKHLQFYLARTKGYRGHTKRLFLTTKKPFGPASLNTLARWVKDILRWTGINTDVYSAGSTRAAAASKAKVQGAPVDGIMKAAGWSRSSTFARFYDKPLAVEDNLMDYVLSNKK
jgi:hypothetical protein